MPRQVVEFLQEANRRVAEFIESGRSQLTGFVPSDYAVAYRALQAIRAGHLVSGNRFCEWGSGFGIVAILAAMLDFDASGIEIEPTLVDHANQLADDFACPVEFVCGSFIPRGAERLAEEMYEESDSFWLVTETDESYDELGLEPDDFDLIFAYPWPNESSIITKLFERTAAHGALLLTFSHLDSLRLVRKVSA
ncbi:MAG: class I SAM-dependent methyltransferase [Planctomycetales bacterium]|nr:class I SAM-dependent methyltransferase [Planctomycetales bacterium]